MNWTSVADSAPSPHQPSRQHVCTPQPGHTLHLTTPQRPPQRLTSMLTCGCRVSMAVSHDALDESDDLRDVLGDSQVHCWRQNLGGSRDHGHHG